MFSFVETRLFTKLVQDYLSDEEYRQVQLGLIQNPKIGTVVRGSGGVRKLRWRAPSRGKRGGYRIIYFIYRPKEVIWMLTIYPKNVLDTIPGHVLRQIRRKVGLSQSRFATLLGVSVRTLQDWEQGRRAPSGAARTLLLIAHRNPAALLDVA